MSGLKSIILAAIGAVRAAPVRHAWVLAWMLVVGTSLAYAASTGLGQTERAVGVFWVENDASRSSNPSVLADRMSARSAWVQLLRSYQVLEPVVREQGLVDGPAVREAAKDLSDNLVTVLSGDGKLLRVELTGDDREAVVRVLDALMERHVDVAADLKRRKLEETLVVLEEQLKVMEGELIEAEEALERFLSSPRFHAGENGPALSTEEARLRRRIAMSETLYNEVRSRVEGARLASVSAIPDVRILDSAALAPRRAVGLPLVALIVLSLLGGMLCLSLVRAGSDSMAASAFGGEFLPAAAILLGMVLSMIGTWMLFSP